MRLITADTVKLKNRLLRFYKEQYKRDPLRRDSMSGLLKGLLKGSSVMTKSAFIEPVIVEDEGKALMVALLAQAERMPDVLQIAFFESEGYHPKAFKLLIGRAEELAKGRNAASISGSLNLHVNYGLGFLSDNYDKVQSFGMAHNPEYFHRYFLDSGFKQVKLVSYKKDMRGLDQLMGDGLRMRIAKRYTVRELDLSNLEKEARLYTEINNQAFSEHLFYYTRIPEEDLELFKDFRFLLKSENLIFVYRDLEPVGFMLWYPDFHQLMEPGESIGVRTVLKNKLHPQRINTFKIVEMGVTPDEQGRGAVLALFQYCLEKIKGSYSFMESGWVMEDNLDSKAFGIKWADGEAKRYSAYIKEL